MQKRIEQLISERFTPEEAATIAAEEFKRAKALVAEGFAADVRAVKKALDGVKFDRLVKDKMFAGLDRIQAESCARTQVNHDNELRQRALRSPDVKEREEAKAADQRDAEVAAEILAEIKAS